MEAIKNKKQRRPNFSGRDLLLLLKTLQNNREVLSYDSNLYGDDLTKAWENIATEFSSQTNIARSGDELRNKFKDLKSRTKKKIAEISRHQKQTGGDAPKVLTEVEQLVEELAGENAMSGLSYFADSFSENPINFVPEIEITDAEATGTNVIEEVSNTQKIIKEPTTKERTQPTKSKLRAVGVLRHMNMKRKRQQQHNKKKDLENRNDKIGEELLQIYKEKLDVSKEKLAVAKEHLAVSKERLEIEKQMLQIAKKNNDANHTNENNVYLDEEEYLAISE